MRFELGKFVILETLTKEPKCFYDEEVISGVVSVKIGVAKALLEVDNTFSFDEEKLKQDGVLVKRV